MALVRTDALVFLSCAVGRHSGKEWLLHTKGWDLLAWLQLSII